MPFKIALSGLHAASMDLQVTGNNMANANTTGFKQSRAEFVDVYASAYGAISAITSGSGVRTSNVRQMFSQGNIEYTDNATDLAITGQGFFMVADSKGRYLTRNGTFGLDRNGYVINSTGQTLQVFPVVDPGTATVPPTFNNGMLTNLQLANTIGAPVATTTAAINVNLDAATIPMDAAGAVGSLYDPGPGGAPVAPNRTMLAFSSTNPLTYDYSTASTVYDSLGAAHAIVFYFRKVTDSGAGSPNNDWQQFATLDGVQIDPDQVAQAGAGATATAGAPAVLAFNTNGTLSTVSIPTNPLPAPPTPTTALSYSNIAVTTGAAPLTITVDFNGTTQYGDKSGVNALTQDGFSTGRLSGFDVEKSGVVFARYTNGNRQVLGMVALANVPNPQGLRQKGDSLWTESYEAGDTLIGQPGTSSLGLIQAGAREASTVEIADQLVNLIVAQRNYQANAQVIQAADQITQTLMNLR